MTGTLRTWVVRGGLVLLALLVLWQRHRISVAEQHARTAQSAADSLRRRGDSLRVVYQTDTLRLRVYRTRWDSIRVPGVVDTVPVRVLVAVADSTIQACTVAIRTCEQRVAVERERGDSLQAAADDWRRVAKGPWLTARFDLTTDLQWEPQASAEVTVGRGKFRPLARAEFGPTSAIRLGVSWSP